jgi:hypothetical protein
MEEEMAKAAEEAEADHALLRLKLPLTVLPGQELSYMS